MSLLKHAPETIFHTFIRCSRLDPLSLQFHDHVWSRGSVWLFTHCVFIFGLNISFQCKMNVFSPTTCPQGQNLPSKHKMQNAHLSPDDVIMILEALVTSGLCNLDFDAMIVHFLHSSGGWWTPHGWFLNISLSFHVTLPPHFHFSFLILTTISLNLLACLSH